MALMQRASHFYRFDIFVNPRHEVVAHQCPSVCVFGRPSPLKLDVLRAGRQCHHHLQLYLCQECARRPPELCIHEAIGSLIVLHQVYRGL